MPQTYEQCPGYISFRKCPYNAFCDNKTKTKTCRIHVKSLYYKCFKKAQEPISIEKLYAFCDICAEKFERNLIGTFECNKHKYCPNCIEDASNYDSCPICLSYEDCISKSE
jgi:hypothetical protein